MIVLSCWLWHKLPQEDFKDNLNLKMAATDNKTGLFSQFIDTEPISFGGSSWQSSSTQTLNANREMFFIVDFRLDRGLKQSTRSESNCDLFICNL